MKQLSVDIKLQVWQGGRMFVMYFQIIITTDFEIYVNIFFIL